MTFSLMSPPDLDPASEPLRLIELLPPLPGEITRATDANEDPIFTLRLNRPLTPYERRVVALELPAARLHDDLSPTIGLGLVPTQMVNRPQGVMIIVAGISAVATSLRATEVETRCKANLAAEAVNRLLRDADAETADILPFDANHRHLGGGSHLEVQFG